MSTVIIGSGIIGTSTAYFLSQESVPQANIHLVEANSELFASASGYAAGFLARDWFSPSLASLGALSYDLHKQLAEEYNGRENWGYSPSTSTSLVEASGGEEFDWLGVGQSRTRTTKLQAARNAAGPAWLIGSHENMDIISNENTTAQMQVSTFIYCFKSCEILPMAALRPSNSLYEFLLEIRTIIVLILALTLITSEPLRLCQFLLSSCLSKGVRLHHSAEVVSIHRDSSGSLSGVLISYENSAEVVIPCTHLLLAAGAWTPQVFSNLFPSSSLKIPISSLAGHSVLLRSPLWPCAPSPYPSQTISSFKELLSPTELSCHAVFTSDPANYSPEVFSRLPGHVYLAGLNSETYPLPPLPTERVIDKESIATLMVTAKRLMGNELEILREAVCWRPVSARGTPYLGKVPGEPGVWIAAAHGMWGISLSLGTGKVMAEMLQGKKTSVDVSRLALG